MSSVSPLDGGYQYQSKAVAELEDEMRLQAKRSREQYDKALASSQEKHDAEFQRRSEQMDRTVQNVRDGAAENVSRERQSAAGEINRLKQATYDKWGRYNGEEADVIKTQFDEAKGAWAHQHENDKRNLQDSEENYDKRLSELNREHAANLERVVQEAHDSASETYTKTYQNQRNANSEQQKKAEKDYEDLNRARMDDQNFQRRETSRLINDQRLDFQHRIQKLNANNDARASEQGATYDDRIEAQTRALNDSHAEEAKVLRDKVKEYTSYVNEHTKGRAEGNYEATTEHEQEWKDRERNIVAGYEREIAKLKRGANETESYLARVNNETIRDKDAYFAKIIRGTTQDNYNAQKSISDTFNRDRSELVYQQNRDKEQTRASHESQLRGANEAREVALQNQAKAYQETIAQSRTTNEDKIKILEENIQRRSTSADASLVSPAAEAGIRATVQGEYEKTFEQERERNKGFLDGVHRGYSDRLQDTIVAGETKQAQLHQELTTEQHRSRKDLLQHIQDGEFTRNNTLRNQEQDHQREAQNMNRSYALMLERQRKQYEEIIAAQKSDSSTRLQSQRQEAEFANRVAQREYAANQNELIRDYEKRLTDQKLLQDDQLNDLRQVTDRSIRERERKERANLEEQARSYEQRISQLEVQQKERERYLTQHYQDEIDRTRRSNDLLAKKKS